MQQSSARGTEGGEKPWGEERVRKIGVGSSRPELTTGTLDLNHSRVAYPT